MVTRQVYTGSSIYFHIPFCKTKCPYCHFYVAANRPALHDTLHQALRKEWELRSPLLNGHAIPSIYFGGGTPSLYSPQAMAEILSWIPYSEDCEITLEANPENASRELFAQFRAIGINRLSIGVQSLDDATLQTLGRGHTAARAKEAIFAARDAGFDNISIDLMLETPSQTLESLRATLDQLADLPISHLSLYNLTFEEGTPFHRKRKTLLPLVPKPEECLSFLQLTVERLEAIGLKRYEISAFGRPSRHNLGYWTARPFLGFGPSAFSYWNGARFRNTADIRRYAELLEQGQDPADFREELPYPKNLRELLAIRLRILEGVEVKELPAEILSTLEELQKQGWLERQGIRWKLSEMGCLFYDSVAEALV